ncbi:MAG: hypothetical protein R8G66_23935 [Cytophagales bacterium]|nr:hypothetical protein [Cytophagales bacterium]
MSRLTKTIHIPESFPISEPMILELAELLSGTDLKTLSRSLRMLTFYYLNREHQELSAEFQVFMKEVPALFDFLDLVEDELGHVNQEVSDQE